MEATIQAITFDTLDYLEKLKSASFTEAQAKVQVESMQGIVKSFDEACRKELATKDDIQEVHSEIQNVRNLIVETKHEILKWMVTGHACTDRTACQRYRFPQISLNFLYTF